MRIAMSLNICVNRFDEAQMIGRLAAAGFDGLDFNFCDLLTRIDWRERREVDRLLRPWQRAADVAGMKWVQAHGPMFYMFGHGERDEFAKSLCVPCIRACEQLGVPWLVLHPDVFPGPFDKAHRQAVRDGNIAFFRSLLPECEKANVGIAIENIFDKAGRHGERNCPRFYAAIPEEQCELIDALNHPLIGACWDTGHARLMGLEPQTCLPILGRRLKALHIQENDGKDDDHMLPFVNGGQGVKWDGFTEALTQAGYQGAFTYEVHNAFNAVPDAFFDHTLRYAVQTAKYITGRAVGNF
jgi:sugar phosphate isomerase/epimerase